MKKELEELYIQWGFPPEKLPDAVAPEIAFGTEQPEVAFGTEQPATDVADLSILDENGPEEIARAYQEDPDKVFELYRAVSEKPDITREEFEENLAKARSVAENPHAFAAEIAFAPKEYDLTAFKKYLKFNSIDVQKEVDEHRYEEAGDWYSWFFWAGGPHILSKLKFPLKKYDFPYHTNNSPFIYNFKDRTGNSLDGKPIRVALFADFGTGSYHSRYIASQIDALSPDYAIHLGDVYYAGREHEFEKHLEQPINPLLSKMQVFTMNSNHEMLSQGKHFFKYIQKKRNFNQDQQGSYFCIRSDRYQIVALDTAYHDDGRHKDQKLQDWFAARMKEGTDKKLITILLTPNEPYELGKAGTTELYDDIKQKLGSGKIFLWFWGNTHYCTFFEPSPQTPFHASCIGHGGYPVNREKILKQKDKNDKITGAFKPPAKWVDTGYRFDKNIRPDLANSGFVLLTLDKDQVKLQYHDWLNRPDMPVFSVKLPT